MIGSAPLMSPLLKAYEKDCHASRPAAPDLLACLTAAYQHLGRNPDPVFAKVNHTIVDLLKADAELGEHAYHNLHHVRDVLFAVVLLLKQTQIDPDAKARVVDCMITAALGHDLHHDGLGTTPTLDLERRSATAVLGVAQDAGLPPADLGLIEGLILASYPPKQLKMREKLGFDKGPDPDELLALMFGEADVMASLTPEFGKILSVALSAEWRKAGRILPSMPDDDAGRAGFLGCYRLVTPTAKALGLDVMVAEQLQVLQRNEV